MIYLLLLLLFLFVCKGIMVSKSLIAPGVISPLSWLIVLSLYSFLNHKFYVLSDKVLIVIFLWNIGLLFGIYISTIFSIKKKVNVNTEFNVDIIGLYYKMALIGFLPTVYLTYKMADSLSGDFFYRLRMANTGLVEVQGNIGIFAYIFTFAYVAYIFELIIWEKGLNKKRIIILLVINLIFGFLTMSKSSFLFLVIPSLVIYLIKRGKVLPNIQVLKFIFIAFILMFGIQNLRDGDNKNGSSDVLSDYLFGGLPALDKIVNSEMESYNFGQNTFSLFNNIYDKLIGDGKSKEKKYVNDITDEGYLYVPMPTNVYTVIGPIWLDFKFFGVVFFSFLVGVLSGYFYRIVQLGYYWGLVIFSYLFCVLVLQFFGEYIFVNMSYLLQLLILSYIPFKFVNKKIVWNR